MGGRWISTQKEASELATVARTLQATQTGNDLLYLRDSETTFDKVSRWIGRGPRTNSQVMQILTGEQPSLSSGLSDAPWLNRRRPGSLFSIIEYE
jgi:hypothetical protein